MLIAIHQPNFFPWLGYFLKISRSDKFVFLDDAQIQKKGSSYTNRTGIISQGNYSWLTVPIERKNGIQNICETLVIENSWKEKMMNKLTESYSEALFFHNNKDFIFDLININNKYISEYNIIIIKEITSLLRINSNFLKSSTLGINSSSTERLVDIIKKINGNHYLSGLGADKYQDINIFTRGNIKLIYNEFDHPEYKQVGVIDHIFGLSIIDFLFNLGIDKTREIINSLSFKNE